MKLVLIEPPAAPQIFRKPFDVVGLSGHAVGDIADVPALPDAPAPRELGGAGFGAAPVADFGAPQAEFGAPMRAFGAPQAEFGAPMRAFGAPLAEFGAPMRAFGAPQAGFGAPVRAFGAPQAGFGAPVRAFGVPQAGFGAPIRAFGAPLGGSLVLDAEGQWVPQRPGPEVVDPNFVLDALGQWVAPIQQGLGQAAPAAMRANDAAGMRVLGSSDLFTFQKVLPASITPSAVSVGITAFATP